MSKLLLLALLLPACYRYAYDSDGWCTTAQGVIAETGSRSSCAGLQRTVDNALVAHLDAGIDYNVSLLRGLTLKVHPQSDGGSFPPTPEQAALGYTRVFGDSALSCFGGRGPTWLNTFDWSRAPVCHELAHSRNQCRPGDDSTNGVPGAFERMKLDQKCAEANAVSPGVKP